MSSGDTAVRTHDETDAPDQITYQFTVDGELWTEWKRSVPRDVPLDEEIRALLRRETTDADDLEEKYRLTAIRVRRHAIRANQKLAAGDDTDDIREEINDIVQLVNGVI